MPKGSQFFKNYKRQKRVQLSDENYNKGMDFSTVPLEDGYVKQMVNFNWSGIQDDRISPRAGFRQFAADIYVGGTAYSADMLLIDGQLCAEADGVNYNQIITGQVTANQLAGSELYLGTGEVNTGVNNVLTRVDLQAGGESILFNRPTTAEIHGIAVTELDNIAEHVGTFAFNNDYYYFKDTGVLAKTKFNAGSYSTEEVTPKGLNPKEAVMWGYNMLSTTPYTFTNTVTGSANIVMSGIVPYKQGTTDIELNPEINQDLTLEAFYTVGTGLQYDFIWEWKEVQSSIWTEFKKETITFASALPLKADISFPTMNIMVRLTAVGYTGGTPNTTPDQVMTVGIAVNKGEYKDRDNANVATYSLHSSTGMSYWKKRLVVWGAKEDPTVLFTSDVNDPSYFPYPNNVELFEEPIVKALPLGDDLLVFTTTKLFILQLTPDGLGWTKRLIQRDLSIIPWDVHLIQPVKNMLFFKSGNYYYMVVPSAGATTGLTIAPISKAIENLLDDFEVQVKETVRKLYGYVGTLELVHYYNYLDFEDIHNVYVFKTESGLYINLALLYNIINRAWKEDIHESQHIVKSFKKDATRKGLFMTLFDFNGKPSIQYLQYDVKETADYYLPDGIPTLETGPTAFEALHTYKNYQLLDTGLREHDSDFKKRYREVQIKFNNISQQALKFYTQFSIDGEIRKSIEKYTLNHVIDPLDPDYGLITMERTLVDPNILPGSTILAENDTDDQYWLLDQSVFPEIFLWKVRIPVSGKGYAPRLVLISYNDQPYEIMNTSFVFRQMYSR